MKHRNVIARERNKLQWTQHKLAAASGVTRQVITRLEAFAMGKVPDSVASVLSPLHPSSIVSLYDQERNEFLRKNRKLLHDQTDYSEVLTDSINYATDYYDSKTSPLVLFRSYLFSEYGFSTSQVQFCRFTGLHLAICNKVEAGKVPFENAGSYADVLRDFLGLSNEQVITLAKIHDDYYVKR